ncbi:MAG: AMIN domain-containing protein [Prolixibacteraceae bacterium]|nr:AMIN domain-containing protein [Prolixibacteraceae bacterium]
MLHPFLLSKKLYLFFLSLIAAMIFIQFTPERVICEESDNYIVSITSKNVSDHCEVRIKGAKPLVSTVYELPEPSRIIVDIADVKLGKESVDKVNNPLIKLKTSEIAGSKPSITRLEFTLPSPPAYTTRQDGNDIILDITSVNSSASSEDSKTILDATSASATLRDVKISSTKDSTIVQILADQPLPDVSHSSTDRNKEDPPQLLVDIGSLTAASSLMDEKKGAKSLAKIKTVQRGSGLRFILDSSHDEIFPFKILQIPNGIEIFIAEQAKQDQISNLIDQKKNIDKQLPDINPLDAKLSPKAKEQQMQDSFNFSGYNKERITVEFQKMDLHNVFNFLRQVSGANIVVDESVQGSLTLVLDDVPWDFALDIILNLKDLEKEERFNTLVIYPKGKGFQWPEQSKNNLSFEADSTLVQQETLLIQQQEKQSVEVVEAKEIMTKGREAEKREDFETAVRLYEQALEKWPNNVKISNKLAAIYLVQLRQNAKSLFFSKRTLQVDPANHSALLNAAIASANMQDTPQAEQYFKKCLNTAKPTKEALLSAAAFYEDRKKFNEAIAQLEKCDALYGLTLDSMIATARIYDKMGNRVQATERYKAILASGFQIPPDLSKYIKGRATLKSLQ